MQTTSMHSPVRQSGALVRTVRAVSRWFSQPRVEGLLNYLAPIAAKPMNLTYDPPPGMPRSTGIAEPHVMRIHDARPIAGRLTLDGEGLALVEHRSAVNDFYDEDEVRRVYYPEAKRLVAEATGASLVVVFDHTIRRGLAQIFPV